MRFCCLDIGDLVGPEWNGYTAVSVIALKFSVYLIFHGIKFRPKSIELFKTHYRPDSQLFVIIDVEISRLFRLFKFEFFITFFHCPQLINWSNTNWTTQLGFWRTIICKHQPCVQISRSFHWRVPELFHAIILLV